MKQKWKSRQILLPFKVTGAKQSTLCMEIEIGKLFREKHDDYFACLSGNILFCPHMVEIRSY